MSNYSHSISKDGKKYRVFYSYISPETGKKHRTCKRGFKLERDAKLWARDCLPKLINELEHTKTPNEKMTMEELINIYKEHSKLRLKESTCITKFAIIDAKILPFFKEKIVHKLEPRDILDWHNFLLATQKTSGEKYTDSYLRTIDTQMTSILNYAVRYHDLALNPMSKTERLGSKEVRERAFWEVDEYLRFRDAIYNDNRIAYYAFEVLFWCGLRLGEMQALTLEDIDFERKTIRVNKTYSYVKGVNRITTPKTTASNRIVPIHDALAEKLKEYVASLNIVNPKTRIFPISKSKLYCVRNRGCEKSGVKKITIHGFRHSHISMLLEAGIPIVAIAPRVGQKRTTMTIHYSHPYENREQEILQSIDKMASTTSK